MSSINRGRDDRRRGGDLAAAVRGSTMITGGDFLDYSGKLAARDGNVEAGQPSAISRAYYGAYHLVRTFLEELGVRVGSRHDAQTYLAGSGHPLAMKAGYLLADLQSDRIRADYNLKEFAPRNEDPRAFVLRRVECAKQIQSLLGQCSREEEKTAITLGVMRYRQDLNERG